MIKRFIHSLLRTGGFRLLREDSLPVGYDLRRDLDLIYKAPIQTIFDVGANRGQSLQRFRRLWPDATIHAFEPAAETFKELNQHWSREPHVRLHRLAMGASDGSGVLYTYTKSEFNSLTQSTQLEEVGSPEAIEIRKLDAVIDELSVGEIDLLKIDVEGFETQVLNGALKVLEARRAHCILAEATVYADDSSHTNLADLLSILRPLGYYLIGFYGQWNRVDNHQFVYFDALFVHRKSIRNTGRHAVVPVDRI